jgi:predicted transcriptional regulator
MGIRVLQPQEVEAFYILPALRRVFAVQLKAQGWSQKKIAETIGVTESAVSQYLSKKRGAKDIIFNAEIIDAVNNASQHIKEQGDFVFHAQQILKNMTETKAICDIHKQVQSEVPHNCDVCFCTGELSK